MPAEARSTHLGVLVVADTADLHAVAVHSELRSLGVPTVTVNHSTVRSTTIVARDGLITFELGGQRWRLDRTTTVWWRRSGIVDTSGLGAEEQQLVADEVPHVLRGVLASAWVRWVDDPYAIERAETKLYQLAVARSLGLAVPTSVVTNDADVAFAFANSHTAVAKPLSPGLGIAPHVDRVLSVQASLVRSYPTLLQELIPASADLRVVAIGGHAWAWRRARNPETIDWRAEDPSGQGFSAVKAPAVAVLASRLTAALGLTMSVQDWLETPAGPIFLEANPQGQWLFLDGARLGVAPALANHLAHSSSDTAGEWPSALRRFGYDFLTKERAPAQDGVRPPTFAPEPWVDAVADVAGIVEVAREARHDAVDAAKTAEDKANRLVQVTLALLTITLGLGAFQLTWALQRSWPALFTAIPICAALIFLVLAAFESSQIDRVGQYRTPQLADLSAPTGHDPVAVILIKEEEGRRLARWTSIKKHSDLMQARAWFSRGLAALLVAAVVAVGCRAATQQRSTDHPSPPAPSTPTPTTTR